MVERTANLPSQYLGQVATNCKPPRQRQFVGAGRWLRTRSTHKARDRIVNPTAIWPNWYMSGQAETANAPGTIRSWLEYPAGTYTEANECIAAAGATPANHAAFPNGNVPLTYNVTVPNGETFWFVTIQRNDNGVLWFQYQHNDNAVPGEGWQTGNTNMPTGPAGTPNDVLSYHPLAILAPTRKPSFILHGTSLDEGSDLIDDQWENGLIRPSLGRHFGYINLAQSGQTLTGYQAAAKGYRQQLHQYVSDMVNNHATNDFGVNGLTVDQMVTLHQTFMTESAAFAGAQGLRFWTSTLPYYHGSNDAYQTVAGLQNTQAGNNAKVVEWNYRVRAGQASPALRGYFDVAHAIDPMRRGYWPVSRNPYATAYENAGVVFTGSIADDVLTVTAVTSGTIRPDDPIMSTLNGAAPNEPRPGTRIRPYGTSGATGTGGTGTYRLTRSQRGTVTSRTMYVGGVMTNDGLHLSDVARDAVRLSGVVDPALLAR